MTDSEEINASEYMKPSTNEKIKLYIEYCTN